MKRLLLVSYHFPPEPAAGAVRPGYLARYLRQYGWDVTVLTRPLGEPGFECDLRQVGLPTEQLQTRFRKSFDAKGVKEYSWPRTALRNLRDAALFPDRTAPWIAGAIRCGHRTIREKQVDAILSTAMPASVHVVAAALKQMHGIPWVADYRDAWSENPYLHKSMVRSGLERALERFLIKRADRVTAISHSLAAQLARTHGRSDVAAIPNAYDPEEWLAFDHIIPRSFSLCYTGTLYEGRRSPEILFNALGTLGDSHVASVDFYGPYDRNVETLAQRFGISSIVRQHGKVARADAMRAQREAAALLILLDTGDNTVNEMGSKFLEYLGARRPIIAFGRSDSVMRPFLEQYELGWFASTADEAKRALREAYSRYARGEYQTVVSEDAAPTAARLAENFAMLLDRLTTAENGVLATV